VNVRGQRLSIGLFVVAFASMIWGFRLLLFRHAPDAFASPDEDLSYGWYVPLFSLYVLWLEREKIVASFGKPCAAGLLLLLPSLLLGYVGVRGIQIRFEILGFVGILLSLALCLFGWRTARQTLFPILFLLFCIPLHSFLDVVTIHLRLFAVSSAYELLRGLGVDVLRQGTMLTSSTGSFAIDVADPCSGLRSLFAMLALTAGYAYFTQPTWLRRGLLFSLAVPIAVLGNIVRIFSIVAVAASCSPTFATGFYHDYSGYVVFLVSIFFMVACGGLVTKGAEACARG
jgi:exosortase